MVGIADIINLVISSLITSTFAYLVLKLLKEERTFLKVLIVVIISNVVIMFVPYVSTFVPIPWFVDLALSILLALIIYKFGLDVSWLHAVVLMVLTPIIALVIAMILAFLGLGSILSLSFLT